LLEAIIIINKLMGLDIIHAGTAHGSMLTDIAGTHFAFYEQLLWR
jgi:hypothetical protein